VRRKARDAEEEADDEIRPRRAPDVHPDPADEGRHPQRPEDDADGAAERADAGARRDCRPEPQALACQRVHGSKREIDPAPDQHRGDGGVEQPLRDVVGDESAEDRAENGRRRHPRDDPPVDAALACVANGAGSGRDGRDGDVGSGGRNRAAGQRHDQGEAQRPEHESQHRAGVPGDERACER